MTKTNPLYLRVIELHQKGIWSFPKLWDFYYDVCDAVDCPKHDWVKGTSTNKVAVKIIYSHLDRFSRTHPKDFNRIANEYNVGS